MKILKCKRCGNEWSPIVENPKQCPKCKSPYWNKNRMDNRWGKNKKYYDDIIESLR